MATNPFYVEPMSLQGLGAIGQAYFKKQAQEEQALANQALQQEALTALETNDPAEISRFMVANPQFSQGIQQAYGFRSDQTKQNAIDSSLRILQGEDPDEVLRDRAAFVSQQGGDPSGTLGVIGDPERAKKLATMTLAANMDPAQLQAMREAGVLGAVETPEEKLKQDLEKEKTVFDRSKKLRDEYTKLSTEFNKVRDAYDRIEASVEEPDAAGDIALIFNYMKMLDPGSVVREGEFATAQNAGGVPTTVRNMFNKLQSGERLQPEQRKMFAGRASKLFNKAQAQNKKDRSKIIGLGKRYNLTEQDIFGEEQDIARGGISVPEPIQASEVVLSSPQYGDITEADIQETMRANNLTREQVLQRLGG